MLVERALVWEPESPAALEVIGHVHLSHGNWPEAELALRQSIAGGNFTARAYTALGLVLLEQRAYVAATASFRYAIQVGNEDCRWASRARSELVRVTTRRGNREARSCVDDTTQERAAG